MSLIQITPEQLRHQANEIRKCQCEQEANINKLKKVVYSLEDSWKGEAQDAFVIKFQSMDFVYKKLYDVLEQYAKLMEKAANEMQSADYNIKRMIHNL